VWLEAHPLRAIRVHEERVDVQVGEPGVGVARFASQVVRLLYPLIVVTLRLRPVSQAGVSRPLGFRWGSAGGGGADGAGWSRYRRDV
jgi:hypothetical protein